MNMNPSTLPQPQASNGETNLSTHSQPQSSSGFSSSDSRNRTGIDISQAMSILSSRARSGGENDLLKAATPELKKLGQTIDLMNSQQWSRVANDGGGGGDPCPCMPSGPGIESNITTSSNTESRTNSREEDKRTTSSSSLTTDMKDTKPNTTSSKLEQEFAKKFPSELMQILFNLQKERVSAYEKFNSGLDVVLQSGNLSQYPPLTTDITASFAVISSSVREIQKQLSRGEEGNDNAEIVKFIKQLQALEKEKLNLTAALHLEKIRERNERLELSDQKDDNDVKNGDVSDGRVLHLLKQGVLELKQKVNECVEKINDVLEELRYAAFELDD